MKSIWTNHLKTEEEKERFRNQLLGSKTVFNRLKDIIKQEDDELTNKELSKDIYQTPNWSHVQADVNGSRRALRTISNLLTLDQDNG